MDNSKNNNIVPYVPITPRVQAKTPKSQLLCQELFSLIDLAAQAQLIFNHETEKGKISISPDQINDLLKELKKHQKLSNNQVKDLDIHILRLALDDLIYPKFTGVFQVTSPIWNNTEVTVWQFQLNQIVRENQMEHNLDVDLLLDQALATVRIWRNSLETSLGNPKVTYESNDLVYKLLDLELKLQQIQQRIE